MSDARKRSSWLRAPRLEHSWPFDRCRPTGLGVRWDRRRERGEHPFEAEGTGVVVRADPEHQEHPEHQLHLDPAQPRGRGRHLHPHGERRSQWQPGHLLHRLLGAWKLQHLGCDRHLRRRRDLCHRRQPGRQRQLCAPTQVQQSFVVLGTQSITFTSTPPGPAVVGGTYTVTASGGEVATRSPSRSTPPAHGSCSISGAIVTFVAVGTCVIDANQAGNASYAAATQVQQSFVVLGTQSITFTSTPPSPAVVGDTYTPDGERRGKWQPGHLLHRLLGAWKLQHLGCDRHLRRRRDLCDRRQPGRQRQL